MNKNQFIKKVAKNCDHDEKTCREVFDSVSETIQETLLYGIDIKITNFMNLTLEVSNKREHYNVATGETRKIPKRYKVKVTLPRYFREKIRKKTVY